MRNLSQVDSSWERAITGAPARVIPQLTPRQFDRARHVAVLRVMLHEEAHQLRANFHLRATSISLAARLQGHERTQALTAAIRALRREVRP